jgi:hypothetical protein
MRKFKKREKERIHHLNELVTDAVAMHNECVDWLHAYYKEAEELTCYVELHAAFPINERDEVDYAALFTELLSIDKKMDAVHAEVVRQETQFAQFNRQYNRLLNHLEKAGEANTSKIFAQMEELALDLNILSYNTKVDFDLRYSLFYDFRQKMRAVLFN